ncbi:MAG: TolC family protein [Acidobacteria bacterium]|nr:TolC family protein [Acidobacteriota bacterium]
MDLKRSAPLARRQAFGKAAKHFAAGLGFALAITAFLMEAKTLADSQTDKAKPAPAIPRQLALGLNHFDAHCASCHAPSGKADNEMGKAVGAADLTSPEVQAKSDAELTRIIQQGVKGTAMPAFAKTHTPAEIKQIIAFLRKLPTLTAAERKKIEAAVPPSARHQHGGAAHDEHHHDQEAQKEAANKQSQPSAAKDQHADHDHAKMQPPAMSQSQAEPKPAAKDEHAGHQMKPDAKDEHAGHQMKPDAKDEHAGHQMKPDAKDEHAGHQMKPDAQDEHMGHQMKESLKELSKPPMDANTPTLSLADLEKMAVQNNPTLAQADAALRAAEGRTLQAGLFPNPLVGYRGEEFALRSFTNKSEHFFFVEQEIPLGGKLKKSRNIFEKEQRQALAESEAQKLRVLNDVRILYYEAVGAQHLVDTRRELVNLHNEAVSVTQELMNVGQADMPDQLEIEVEAQKADLDLVEAENQSAKIWQTLANVVGNPQLPMMPLSGDLEKTLPTIDRDQTLAFILQESPEVKVAKAKLERAQATLIRAHAERVPDMIVRGGFGYSTERLEIGNAPFARKTGPEANLEIGFRLPVFNRNQGNIATAKAELDAAQRELQRVELTLRTRLAAAFMEYQNAKRMVDSYQNSILPRAKQAFALYQSSFSQMAAAYPQVLIAKRSYYQAQGDYVNALVKLWQNALHIQGFLLSGGLDAVNDSRGAMGIEAGTMNGLKSGAQGLETNKH